MGMVNVGARKRAARKRYPRVVGVCCICKKTTQTAIIVKGKVFTDGDGNVRQAADTTYCRQCRRMQNKGLLNAGADRKPQDSTGKPCAWCNAPISGPHAHKAGKPYHRECIAWARR